MNCFAGKTYWIIGASAGIGYALACKLSEAGARIIATARNSERLESLKANNIICLPGDMLAINDPARLCSELAQMAVFPDGMIYCVGLGNKMRLHQISLSAMQEAMLGNCFAFVELTRLLASSKRKDAFLKIVAISSLASTEFQKYLTLYAMGKAALEASIRCLASELGSKNVRINSIRPAFVDTPRLTGLKAVTDDIEVELKRNGYQPLGLIPADAVALMAMFLLGDSGSWLNGVNLPVNAGAQC